MALGHSARPMNASYPINPSVKRLLEGELLAGARLVWSQQPRPITFVQESLPMFFFGIPFFALPAFMFYYLVLSQWDKPAWPLLLLVLSFIGLFAAIGAGMLLSPAWAYWKALRTAYAITDQRCIAIAAPWRRRVQSFLAGPGTGEVIDFHRLEDRLGRGNLVFHQQAVSGKHGIRYYEEGFIGIHDVREAEDKVRELIAKTSAS
jgi:hypothetical protein